MILVRCSLGTCDSKMRVFRRSHMIRIFETLDYSLAFDEEVRGDLMLEVIRNEGASIFRGRNLLRETSETVDDTHLLVAWAQRFLETALRDLASGKGKIDYDRR